MPTYDYDCKACGAEVEIFHSIADAPKRKCPECGRLKLSRRIGMGAGVIFKGSGFYETDYRSESYKKAAKDDKPAAKESDSKSDSGSKGGDGGSKKKGEKSSSSDSSSAD